MQQNNFLDENVRENFNDAEMEAFFRSAASFTLFKNVYLKNIYPKEGDQDKNKKNTDQN